MFGLSRSGIVIIIALVIGLILLALYLFFFGSGGTQSFGIASIKPILNNLIHMFFGPSMTI